MSFNVYASTKTATSTPAAATRRYAIEQLIQGM